MTILSTSSSTKLPQPHSWLEQTEDHLIQFEKTVVRSLKSFYSPQLPLAFVGSPFLGTSVLSGLPVASSLLPETKQALIHALASGVGLCVTLAFGASSLVSPIPGLALLGAGAGAGAEAIIEGGLSCLFLDCPFGWEQIKQIAQTAVSDQANVALNFYSGILTGMFFGFNPAVGGVIANFAKNAIHGASSMAGLETLKSEAAHLLFGADQISLEQIQQLATDGGLGALTSLLGFAGAPQIIQVGGDALLQGFLALYHTYEASHKNQLSAADFITSFSNGLFNGAHQLSQGRAVKLAGEVHQVKEIVVDKSAQVLHASKEVGEAVLKLAKKYPEFVATGTASAGLLLALHASGLPVNSMEVATLLSLLMAKKVKGGQSSTALVRAETPDVFSIAGNREAVLAQLENLIGTLEKTKQIKNDPYNPCLEVIACENLADDLIDMAKRQPLGAEVLDPYSKLKQVYDLAVSDKKVLLQDRLKEILQNKAGLKVIARIYNSLPRNNGSSLFLDALPSQLLLEQLTSLQTAGCTYVAKHRTGYFVAAGSNSMEARAVAHYALSGNLENTMREIAVVPIEKVRQEVIQATSSKDTTDPITKKQKQDFAGHIHSRLVWMNVVASDLDNIGLAANQVARGLFESNIVAALNGEKPNSGDAFALYRVRMVSDQVKSSFTQCVLLGSMTYLDQHRGRPALLNIMDQMKEIGQSHPPLVEHVDQILASYLASLEK